MSTKLKIQKRWQKQSFVIFYKNMHHWNISEFNFTFLSDTILNLMLSKFRFSLTTWEFPQFSAWNSVESQPHFDNPTFFYEIPLNLMVQKSDKLSPLIPPSSLKKFTFSSLKSCWISNLRITQIFLLKFPWISCLEKTSSSGILNVMLEKSLKFFPSDIPVNLMLENSHIFPLKSSSISWLKNPTCFFPLKSYYR